MFSFSGICHAGREGKSFSARWLLPKHLAPAVSFHPGHCGITDTCSYFFLTSVWIQGKSVRYGMEALSLQVVSLLFSGIPGRHLL